MTHKHSVYDSDTYFEINPVTKVLKNASSQKTTIMQYDHNSERFTFSLPRMIEGHDMSLCDKVRVHYINEASNKNGVTRDVYDVEDLQTDPEDENTVICSWLISGNATQYAGSLSFRLQFICYAEDGVTIEYAWHTAIYNGIYISDGINNGEAVVEQYSDVLSQWEYDLFNASEEGVINIAHAKKTVLEEINNTKSETLETIEQMSRTEQNAIATKGQEVLNTIPADYTELANKGKSPAIVCEAVGDTITVDDASDMMLHGLKIFGRTIQNGIPTPEAPVPLDSVGDKGSVNVTVCGRNLLTRQLFEDGGEYSTGLSLSVTEDGGLHIKGTAKKNANVGFMLSKPLYQGEKVYIYYSGIDKQSIRMRGEDANGSGAYGTNPDVGMYTIKSLSNLDFFKATSFAVRVPSGTIVDTVVYMMVSGEPAEYEAPKDSQTLTVPTPNGLPGIITLTADGNYDSEDMMDSWICDEVDFGSGQYIQRIGRIDSYSGEVIPREYMSTTGELSAGATVLYVLEKETAVPMTDGELAQYAALHTNYPNTAIFNDSGAGMEVKYVVDTKTYIDTKFAELAAAILKIDLSGYMKASDYPTEKWSFTLDDGSVVEKDVVTG